MLSDHFKNGRSFRYHNREIILRAQEHPQGVYCVDTGFIRVYSITDAGEENIHIVYKSGDVFPLTWVFKDTVRNVFYEAMGTTRLFRLERDDFTELVKNKPPIARAILQQLTDQLNIYADRLDNLEYTSALDRVVYRLLFLAGRFGEKKDGKVVIRLPLTHQHIARSVNLARETVSREIEKLEHQGLISRQKRLFVINDIHKLEAMIGEIVSSDLWGLK